jgi:hypothetical protein
MNGAQEFAVPIGSRPALAHGDVPAVSQMRLRDIDCIRVPALGKIAAELVIDRPAALGHGHLHRRQLHTPGVRIERGCLAGRRSIEIDLVVGPGPVLKLSSRRLSSSFAGHSSKAEASATAQLMQASARTRYPRTSHIPSHPRC